LIEIKKNKLIRINVEMVSVKEMQLEEIIVKGKEMPGKEPLVLERFSSQIANCFIRIYFAEWTRDIIEYS